MKLVLIWAVYLTFASQVADDRFCPANGCSHSLASVPLIPDSIYNRLLHLASIKFNDFNY